MRRTEPKDRFVISILVDDAEVADRLVALMPEVLARSNGTGTPRTPKGWVEIAGSIDGSDLGLITSMAANMRTGLRSLNVGRIIAEGVF